MIFRLKSSLISHISELFNVFLNKSLTLGTGILVLKIDENVFLLHIIASLPSFILIYQP